MKNQTIASLFNISKINGELAVKPVKAKVFEIGKRAKNRWSKKVVDIIGTATDGRLLVRFPNGNIVRYSEEGLSHNGWVAHN